MIHTPDSIRGDARLKDAVRALIDNNAFTSLVSILFTGAILRWCKRTSDRLVDWATHAIYPTDTAKQANLRDLFKEQPDPAMSLFRALQYAALGVLLASTRFAKRGAEKFDLVVFTLSLLAAWSIIGALFVGGPSIGVAFLALSATHGMVLTRDFFRRTARTRIVYLAPVLLYGLPVLLIIAGIIMAQNAIENSVAGPPWFTRVLVGIVCYGSHSSLALGIDWLVGRRSEKSSAAGPSHPVQSGQTDEGYDDGLVTARGTE
jgi:hypothetical protein